VALKTSCPVHHAAGEDAEERDVTDMRLRVRLEDLRRERIRVDGVDLDGLVPLSALEGVDLLHLEGRRHELHHLGEERGDADHVVGGHAEEREQVAALHRLLHALDRSSRPISPPSR
jgi:hypothetical protein